MKFLCSTLLVLCLCLIGVNASAQKLYVWAPEAATPTRRPLFESIDTVDIVVFDGRNILEKSKVEYSSEELVEHITKEIQSVYDGATFDVLPKTKYYKAPAENHVTIKVGIAAYQAGFGANIDVAIGSVGGNFSYGIFPKGKWNGVTSFFVRVYDRRNGLYVTQEKEIVSQIDKSNTGGYTTAKKCLKESYSEASSKMYFFIDSVFMQ